MDCFEGSSVQVGDGISDYRPGIYIPWTPCIKLLVALAEAYAGGREHSGQCLLKVGQNLLFTSG